MHPATLVFLVLLVCTFSLVSTSHADSEWTAPGKAEHDKWKDRKAPKKEKKQEQKGKKESK